MDALSYNEAADRLNQEWQIARPNYEHFCNDGIMGDANKYFASQLRIMYLLKESNDNYINIRGTTQRGADIGSSQNFWGNLGYWTRIIKAYFDGALPVFCPRAELTENLFPVAYVNVKKNAVNNPQSQSNDIQKYANNDKDFLSKQIDMIKPNVVVCCGDLQINRYRDIYNLWKPNAELLKQLADRLYTHNGRIVIDFYHPSIYNKNFEDLFNELKAICDNGKLLFDRIRIEE